MSNEIKSLSENAEGHSGVSRRGLLRGAALAAGGAAVLAATVMPAQAKMKQAAAGYQDKPNGDKSCASCALFQAPSSCSLVDGTVSATGYCRFYSKKS